MSKEPGRPTPTDGSSPHGPGGSEGARESARQSARESPGLFIEDAAASGVVANAEPPADWRRLLSGGSPRKILARLVQGDPLGVRRLVGRELRASAVLLDADRVQLRALARCARHAARYQGRPNIEAWLRAQVSRAVREILREEDRARRESPSGDDDQDAHTDLARPLGLDPRATRAACDAFNRRPIHERLAFFRLLIEHASLEEVARETGSTVNEVARRARRALDAARGVARTREHGEHEQQSHGSDEAP